MPPIAQGFREIVQVLVWPSVVVVAEAVVAVAAVVVAVMCLEVSCDPP